MYANCEAYILPSHGEGLPLTVLEAWSWGKLVLITPECHLPEGYDANAAIKIEASIDSIKKD
jgi:poly(glycerol-phosphate) alpha-glucosyltransferase